MVKVLVALVKVRGQLLSEDRFVCAWFFGLGLGPSGSGCCALAVLKNRKARKASVQRTNAAVLIVDPSIRTMDLRRTSTLQAIG
jgi:hypothetical protein